MQSHNQWNMEYKLLSSETQVIYPLEIQVKGEKQFTFMNFIFKCFKKIYSNGLNSSVFQFSGMGMLFLKQIHWTFIAEFSTACWKEKKSSRILHNA